VCLLKNLSIQIHNTNEQAPSASGVTGTASTDIRGLSRRNLMSVITASTDEKLHRRLPAECESRTASTDSLCGHSWVLAQSRGRLNCQNQADRGESPLCPPLTFPKKGRKSSTPHGRPRWSTTWSRTRFLGFFEFFRGKRGGGSFLFSKACKSLYRRRFKEIEDAPLCRPP
jgi:hypothetical protein